MIIKIRRIMNIKHATDNDMLKCICPYMQCLCSGAISTNLLLHKFCYIMSWFYTKNTITFMQLTLTIYILTQCYSFYVPGCVQTYIVIVEHITVR